MMHPQTALSFISAPMGFGVIATHFIPQGTITWVLDELDYCLPPGAITALPGLLRGAIKRWLFLDARGFVLTWDHGRFVNHSCDPNCSGSGSAFEIAVRDIQAGEQLTDDYGRLRAQADFNCACGSAQCRGTIFSDGTDLARYGNTWDAIFNEAFPRITLVEQPLWELVHATDKDTIAQARRI